MNADIHREKIRLTTHSDQYTIAPGNSLEIPLTLANLGDMPEQLQIGVIGIPKVWVSIGKSALALQPGEQRRVSLTFRPPSATNAPLGRYRVILRATSITNPAHTTQCQVTLTIAGYELKCRVDVLLEGLLYTAAPGEQLRIPVMLISHGLGVDIFQLSVEDLPEDWITVPVAALRLEPAEVKEAALFVQPPRSSATLPGSYPFRIVIASLEAHNPVARIDCVLSVPPFIEFKSSVKAAPPERNQAEQVTIQNLSNIPVVFQMTYRSPTDELRFETLGPRFLEVASGGEAVVEYSARPIQRRWVGGEKHYPYSVSIQAAEGQVQTLEALWIAKGLLPVWVLFAGGGALLFLCLYLVGMLLFPGG